MNTKHQKVLLTDEALVTEIVKNLNNELFGVIYDRYASKVFNRCLSLVKDRATAADLTQDIFLKIFAKLSSFKNQSLFSTWVYSITYNECIDHIRKSKKYRFFAPMDEAVHYLNNYTQDSEDYEEEIMQLGPDILKELMERISPQDKLLLLMKYQDKMTVKQIQNVINISESAVKMRLKRAKMKLITIYTAQTIKPTKRVMEQFKELLPDAVINLTPITSVIV